MEKRAKKLVLAKETVGNMEASHLNKVAGGSALPMFHCGGGTGGSCHICDPEPISADTNC